MDRLNRCVTVILTTFSLVFGTIIYLSKSASADEVYIDNNCRRNQELPQYDRFTIFYSSQIRSNSQVYLFYAGRYQDGAVIFCISRPNFKEAKTLSASQIQNQFIDKIVKDPNRNATFIVTVAEDNNSGAYTVNISSQRLNTLQATTRQSTSSRQQTTTRQTPNTRRSATSSNTTARPKVPTWNQFVASLEGDYINTDFDLPQEFRNGYVYRVQGANWVGVYILKAGLPSYPLPVTSELNQITDGGRYIQSGQAIFLLWDLSFSAPRNANDTQVRFSERGEACLRNTCLTAPSMSNAQISRILLSERPISQPSVAASNTQRSQSSGQQTATGRVSTPRQLYRNTRELGIAQFVYGNKELKSSQEKLQAASKSQYITNIDAQNIDFLKQEITEIRPADCRAYGYSCERRKINYGDYLSLRIKVKLQTNVFSDGMNFYEEVRKYNDRLAKDNRYGGKAVADKIVSEFNRIWNNLETQQQRRDSQATLSVPQRLLTALDQTREDVSEFSVSVFKTSAKVLATVTQIKDLSETITSLRSINPETLNRVAGAPKYILAVTQILKDSGEAFLSFDSEKLRDNTLKAAQETIELVNAQDQRVAGSGNVIKAYMAATELIDKDKLLRQAEVTNAIDDFDKFYLAAAQFSKAIDVIIAGLSIPFSEIKVVDTLVKKADTVNILLFDALEFSYKSDVRRKYMRWEYYYNRNQIAISGLSSFIDYAAQQVGEYLVRARTDVVTRRSDGTIAVSIDGVLYPQ